MASNVASKFPAVLAPMLPAGTFTGKVALVTGGGTGLGKGMAKTLSALGASVVIASRKLPICEKAAAEISNETGNKVLPLTMDVRDPKSVKETVDASISEFGGLPTLVINNAAGNFISPTERLSSNAFRTVVDIVLNGTANVTMDIGKRMIKEQQRGAFLNITTWYAEAGSPFVVPSACAKAGVEAMTKSLAAEWGRYGIRTNCIQPGPFPTEGAWGRLDPSGEGKALILDRTPVKRLGEIPEIGNLASYILSDYASFMNGEIVCLDGGERRGTCGMFSQLDKVSEEKE